VWQRAVVDSITMSKMSDYIQGDLESLQAMLGPSIDISGAATEKDIGEINFLASQLYRESSILITVIGSIAKDGDKGVGLPRNQAICAGLILHTSKLMVEVVHILAKHGSSMVVKTVNRSILEAMTNLQFLITKDDNEYYDKFVAYSFGPERELYDDINAEIKKNDGVIQPIEERMLKSIAAKCKASAVNIDEIPAKHREWATNMRERLKAIDIPGLYNTYRTLSHSIHVSWVELLSNDLEQDAETGLFKPRLKLRKIDARLLSPIAVFVLEASSLYIKRFLGAIRPVRLLLERLEAQIARLIEIDAAHERLLSASKKS